jgi:[acyl-carrier-protein] S-malonyltransferase
MSKCALIFPGQGAQAVGMARDLAEAFPACRKLFDEADRVLGFDLSRVCFEGPMEDLTRSSLAQPAIFVASMVCRTALAAKAPSFSPTATAGLSSGEWAALHLAGVLSYGDTLRVLQARGRFMQEACEEKRGGMLSVIGLGWDALQQVCQKTGVEIANLNSPEQTVLSGAADAIAKAENEAKAAGAKRAIRLNVAGAFHSSLMKSAAEKLRDFLAGIVFRPPAMPVCSNVTGKWHSSDPEEIRALMVQQVTGSVRWVDCVAAMKELGVTTYVECGPGKVLTGLIRRIDNAAQLHNIHDLPSLEATVAACAM